MTDLAIGIDLGGTHIKGALVSAKGDVVAESTRMTSAETGPQSIIRRMGELILELKTKSLTPVTGVGVGSPGPLTIRDGVIHSSPNLPGWHEVPMRAWLKEQTGFTIEIDNDANCAALGEWTFGSARGCKHVVMLTFGTGIGGGVIINGKMLHGRDDGAAELGHFIIDKHGPRCACGNRGCFEAHCSASAVRRRATEAAQKAPASLLHSYPEITARAVSDAAEKGDATARYVIENVSEDLAIGIAGLINIFNPEIVVLAGGLMRGGHLYISLVRERVPRYCFPSMSKDMKIEVSTLHDRAGILGAAQMVFHARTTGQPWGTL